MYDRRRDPEAFRTQVLQLARSLDVEQFRPLSEGVGLGGLSPAKEKLMAPSQPQSNSDVTQLQRPQQVAVASAKIPDQVQRLQAATVPQHQYLDRQVQAPPRKPAASVSLAARLLALVFDLSLVTVSAAALLSGVLYVIFGQLDLTSLLVFTQEVYAHGQTLPALAMFFAVIFTMFILYWLVFRFVAGVTLGKFLFASRPSNGSYQTANPLDNSVY